MSQVPIFFKTIPLAFNILIPVIGILLIIDQSTILLLIWNETIQSYFLIPYISSNITLKMNFQLTKQKKIAKSAEYRRCCT